ncbi:MAG: 3'(2'),5'-bisphosphate nucleotidase CysQ [Alphaproteobacteria bacterium]|nr:3'(2'),5'-bisphosphate nucleotidase CysQ [Alphaproteobacteria bacterium]
MLYSPYALKILSIAEDAGEIIMPYYQDVIDVMRKEDDSPVTAADIAANHYILEKLQALTPDIPVISEEKECDPLRIDYPLFWCVDPLDGTKSFILKKGDFTVNIALIENGTPIGGAVVVPAMKISYYVGEDGVAYRKEGSGSAHKIKTRDVPAEGVTVVASRSHADEQTMAYIETLPKVADKVSVASSVKFCMIAEGKADVYPRFGPTCIWDTAAGHAVLMAAGGQVFHAQTHYPLTYSGLQLLNPFFIAIGYK